MAVKKTKKSGAKKATAKKKVVAKKTVAKKTTKKKVSAKKTVKKSTGKTVSVNVESNINGKGIVFLIAIAVIAYLLTK